MITQNVAHGKTITIIGGQGAMGQLFRKYWLSSGAIVQSLDHNDWDKASTLLPKSDLIIICVPIKDTLEIIQKTSSYISKDTVLADFTSIKKTVIEEMQKYHTGPILGLHPMFGPTISSPYSQVIINCGGQKQNDAAWVIESLKQIGFSIQDMDAKEHDNFMSFIQGIEHFSTFTLGSFLKQQNIHPQKLLELASPIYQAKLALLGRIFDQDAELYADIIMSDDKRLELIKLYISHMQNWLDKLKDNLRDDFVHEFKDISKWMGEFTHKSQLASDQFLTEVSNSFQETN